MERFQLRRSNSSPISPLHSHNLSREGNCFPISSLEMLKWLFSFIFLLHFSQHPNKVFFLLFFFPLLAFFILFFRNKSNAKENQSVFTWFFLKILQVVKLNNSRSFAHLNAFLVFDRKKLKIIAFIPRFFSSSFWLLL